MNIIKEKKMEQKIEDMLSNLDLTKMSILAEGEKFKIMFDSTVDPIVSFLSETPNYFLVNKTTGKIEGAVMSEYSANTTLTMAEQMYQAEDTQVEGDEGVKH